MSFATIVNGHWVHQMSPFLIQFSENFGLRYYGVAYLLGFLTAAWLFYRYARAGRSLLPAALIGDLMVAIILGVMIGGRLGYFLFYTPGVVLHDPLVLFRVWEGGMASHGGMLGVVIALVWFGRKQRIPFLHLGDLVVSVAAAGLFFGRIANFINGELWGKVSSVSWAVIFPHSAPSGTPFELIPPRHPSQLYEAALEGLVLFGLMQLCFWKTPMVEKRPGRLCGLFLLAYAAARIVSEMFREPDAGIEPLLGLSRGTFYSLFMIIGGLYLIFRHATPLPFAPAGSTAGKKRK